MPKHGEGSPTRGGGSPTRGDGTELLRRARSGDRGAYDALADRLEPRVRAFARSRIHGDARLRLDLDEIVQDTFVRAYQSLGSFRGDEVPSFARWLMGVARIAVIKAAHPEGTVWSGAGTGLEAEIAESGPSPSRVLRREERFERLQASLESLSADYREVLYLSRIEGLSMKEIAERMGRSPQAVKKLFGRALVKLRQRFGDTESVRLPDRRLRPDADDGPAGGDRGD